ncbi:MAG: hypothetical protein AB7G93_22830 [Bdellovibrionales bacterium]
MQPRLSSSRKWTSVPEELIQQIQSVFRENFQQHVQGGTVEAQGRIYPGEILIQVGYRAKDALKQNNFEISIAYKRDKDNVLKLLHLAVDAAGSLFELFFNTENDHDFPRIWDELDFEGRKIHVQYTTENTPLEAEADRLLGKDTVEALTRGDWDEELGPDQIKARLGLDPKEDE